MRGGDRRPKAPWRVRLAWAALTVFSFAGIIGLVSVLHPQGKQDAKGVPIALFALTTIVVGSVVISRMVRPPRS